MSELDRTKHQVSFKLFGIEFSGPIWLGIVVLLLGVAAGVLYSFNPNPFFKSSGGEISIAERSTITTTEKGDNEKCDFFENIDCSIK